MKKIRTRGSMAGATISLTTDCLQALIKTGSEHLAYIQGHYGFSMHWD